MPAAVVGLGFKDTIESLATPRFVGIMLCVTAVVLFLSQRAKVGNGRLERPALLASALRKRAPSSRASADQEAPSARH